MTTIREQVLRSHLSALELASGQQAGEEQILAALELSAGSKLVVARPEHGLQADITGRLSNRNG